MSGRCISQAPSAKAILKGISLQNEEDQGRERMFCSPDGLPTIAMPMKHCTNDMHTENGEPTFSTIPKVHGGIVPGGDTELRWPRLGNISGPKVRDANQ